MTELIVRFSCNTCEKPHDTVEEAKDCCEPKRHFICPGCYWFFTDSEELEAKSHVKNCKEAQEND